MSAVRHNESDQRARSLLLQVCADHGLSAVLVEDLLTVERQHSGMARRRGIYDRLNECLAAHEEVDE